MRKTRSRSSAKLRVLAFNRSFKCFITLLAFFVCLLSVMCNQGVQGLYERRPHRLQFSAMIERKLSQYLYSMRGKIHEHAPLICLITTTLDEISLHQPVNQLYCTMMLEL